MVLTPNALRRWGLVHKWTSLVATLFLLLLCLTGLPLIFHHEIHELTRAPEPAADVDPAARASYASIAADAAAQTPGGQTLYLSWDDDPEHPVVYAITGTAADAPGESLKQLPYDTRVGTRLDAPPVNEGFMAFLLDLHVSLLMGLPGTLFIGLIGLVFLAALVSGVVVYAPFMRRLAFGTLRRDRSAQVKWLDTHNLTGIVATAWVAVVTMTGFILAMETPITLLWQADQLAELTAPYEGQTPPSERVPVDVALQVARAAAPGAALSFVAWPGTRFSSPHHYLVALRGETPLTERLLRVALVDASTGALTAFRETPWYVKAAFLSAPLHFGDYGGMPLKIIWALLDLTLVAVLLTGLYLWWKKRREPAAIRA